MAGVQKAVQNASAICVLAAMRKSCISNMATLKPILLLLTHFLGRVCPLTFSVVTLIIAKPIISRLGAL